MGGGPYRGTHALPSPCILLVRYLVAVDRVRKELLASALAVDNIYLLLIRIVSIRVVTKFTGAMMEDCLQGHPKYLPITVLMHETCSSVASVDWWLLCTM